MNRLKTTYWLLIVIGLLSVLASIYLFMKGKSFNDYFISGFMGLLFAVLGYVSLKKMKNNTKEE